MSTLLIVILAVALVLGALVVAYRVHYRRAEDHHDENLAFIRHLAEEMEHEREARSTGRHHLRPVESTTEIPVYREDTAEDYEWPAEEASSGTFSGTVRWAEDPETLVMLREQPDRLTEPEDR
jgi:hypothetical protein